MERTREKEMQPLSYENFLTGSYFKELRSLSQRIVWEFMRIRVSENLSSESRVLDRRR